MKFKEFFQGQVYRLQKIAAPMSLVLLTLNLSLTAYSYVGWRIGNVYLGVGVVFLFVLTTVLFLANANIKILKMHLAERRVADDHNPRTVYSFTPKEIILQRQIQIPLLRSMGLVKEAARIERWNRLGYIPRDEYDPDLLEYYKDTGERI